MGYLMCTSMFNDSSFKSYLPDPKSKTTIILFIVQLWLTKNTYNIYF